jgi:hypothetical protein
MRIPLLSIAPVVASVLAGGLIAAKNVNGYAAYTILNVSYDPRRANSTRRSIRRSPLATIAEGR